MRQVRRARLFATMAVLFPDLYFSSMPLTWAIFISPFANFETLNNGLIELWADVYSHIFREAYLGICKPRRDFPDCQRRLTAAAWWYAGMGKLFFRNPTSDHRRNQAYFEHDSSSSSQGAFILLSQRGAATSTRKLKERHPRQETNASRTVKAVKHVRSSSINIEALCEAPVHLTLMNQWHLHFSGGRFNCAMHSRFVKSCVVYTCIE